MAVNIDITNEWPTALPLPFYEFAGDAGAATLHGSPNRAKIKRRSRQERVHVNLNVKWVFQRAEMKAFLAFWEDTLGNGTASFKMELRYPKGSDLDTWIVKFITELDVVTPDHGTWEVAASIQLVQSATVEDKATIVDYGFYVQSEETGGGSVLFCVVGEESDSADPQAFNVQRED
jgi:hypothetical protein